MNIGEYFTRFMHFLGILSGDDSTTTAVTAPTTFGISATHVAFDISSHPAHHEKLSVSPKFLSSLSTLEVVDTIKTKIPSKGTTSGKNKEITYTAATGDTEITEGTTGVTAEITSEVSGKSDDATTEQTGASSAGPTGEASTGTTGEASTGPTGEASTGPTEEASTGPTGEASTGPTGEASTGPTGEASTGPTGEASTGPTGEASTGATGQTGETSIGPTGQTGETSSEGTGTPAATTQVAPKGKDGLSKGAVAGIVIGCLLAVALVAAAIVFVVRQRGNPEIQRLRV